LTKRRTHPHFLSDDEAAREERRTTEMVNSIAGTHPRGSDEKKAVDVVESKRSVKVACAGKHKR
jgi:hypothetical protein